MEETPAGGRWGGAEQRARRFPPGFADAGAPVPAAPGCCSRRRCMLPAGRDGSGRSRPSLLIQSCRVTRADPPCPVEGSRGHEALPVLLPSPWWR